MKNVILLFLLSFKSYADTSFCDYVREVNMSNKTDLFWLNQKNPKLDQRTQEQRNDWIENYVLTIHAIEESDKYLKQCERGS